MEGHEPHSLEAFPKYFQDGDKIIHYTCNSPKEDILKKHGIKSIGNEFGCLNNREVLEIPFGLYAEKGFRGKDHSILTINCEKLMRDLKRK